MSDGKIPYVVEVPRTIDTRGVQEIQRVVEDAWRHSRPIVVPETIKVYDPNAPTPLIVCWRGSLNCWHSLPWSAA
jgi:hypothetical protein